mmetsp:Transcript_20332/g.65501  ORF Transcript_20332/g.65501 Transcript_20332/m.65501 type:complete len:295 (-) Transcript_20332:237-1121(-)|eukprot:CAMPEP_0118902668 /NCGR_PEP_ID=MMETSP1166-20130328/7855_1 /TAXON_ID=1104430 /ORGANISM="Chrysoreinhardia sp, Strain CCMP3193" /LENGTH=294 /DNA_ID=CAMNT_0006841881 /DNA_START=39 /DNA_END=923 /DNA_ORIENTATION=+
MRFQVTVVVTAVVAEGFDWSSNCSTSAQREHALRLVLDEAWPVAARPAAIQAASEEFWRKVDPSTLTVKVLNAGFGTTGTRDLHWMVAARNVSAIHNVVAHSPQGKRHSMEMVRLSTAFQAAHEALQACSGDCGGDEALKVRSALRDVLASGAVYLSDSPYSEYVAEIVTAIPSIKVVQTLRDPLDWASRRTEFLGHVNLCRRDTVVQGKAPSYFDWLACAEDRPLDHITFPIGPADQLTVAAAVAAHHDYVRRLAGERLALDICVWDRDVIRQKDLLKDLIDRLMVKGMADEP